jgi:hypothetical protein
MILYLKFPPSDGRGGKPLVGVAFITIILVVGYYVFSYNGRLFELDYLRA